MATSVFGKRSYKFTENVGNNIILSYLNQVGINDSYIFIQW
jgi:hypothetical protein